MVAGRHEHVRGREHREHAQRLVVLDEPHAAHVGGQVEDVAGALDRRHCVGEQGHVEDTVVGLGMTLVPLVERLDVDAAHLVAVGNQAGDEVAADEAAAAGDEDDAVGAHGRRVHCNFSWVGVPVAVGVMEFLGTRRGRRRAMPRTNVGMPTA